MAAGTSGLQAALPGVPSAEWWQRAQAALYDLAGRHPRFVVRVLLVRSVVLWVLVVGLLLAVVAVPPLRPAFVAFVSSLLLVVVWFVMARTKTLTWSTVAAVFSLSVGLAVVVGRVSREAALWAGVLPVSDGAVVAVAAFTEESWKLLPLLVLAMVAPGRVRRYAAVDWAVLGFAAGAGFNAFEDGAREVFFTLPARGFALLDELLGIDYSLSYGLNPFLSARFTSLDGVAVAPGHHMWTALTATCLGLAVALWRWGAGRPTRWVRWGVRVAAVGVAGSGVVRAVAEHAGYNAWAQLPDERSITAEGFPGLLAVVWTTAGRGHGTHVLVGLLFVVCLVIDVHRRAAAGGVGVAVMSSAAVMGGWTRASRLVMRGPLQWWHDLRVIVLAHARQPGEPRSAALARGRAAVSMTREVRELAMLVTTPGVEPGARRVFAVVWTVIGVAVVLGGTLLGIWVASRIGITLLLPGDDTVPFDPDSPLRLLADYLAGLLDRLGDWWSGLSPAQQFAVGFAVGAVIVLSGGTIGAGVFVSGVATYVAAKGNVLADLTRDPGDTVRAYAASATPADLLVDGGEFLLTFVPGGLGAGTGRLVRAAAADYARDPTAWRAAQRARWADDTGSVHWGTPDELASLADALRPAKMDHVFDPKHKFTPLIEMFGSRERVMEEFVRSIGGPLPASGPFEVVRQIGEQAVVIRGAVVDGVPRIGTAFTP